MPATTSSGLEVDVLYTPSDLRATHPIDDIGFPGEYPFTRGIQPTMYRGRHWTIRQYSGLGTAEDTNARYKFLLEQGQTGLSVALDLPSQIGYDSDDPFVAEEVGRVGVAIDTLDDLERVFDGIALDQISTSFTVNGTAAAIMAMYIAVGEKQGVPPAKLTGTVQNDPLKEFAARGTWNFPPEPAIRLVVDMIEYATEHMPRYNPISVAGAHFHDAGATAIQELAFTLADGITYVERCLQRGLDVDRIGPQLSFFFYTHMDFFEEIAKYRAGRRMWARIMKERFGAKDPRSLTFRAGLVCGGASLTAQQPQNNVVRVALECLASVLGGVQSIFTAAYDEAFAIPTEETAELALRTQQIIAHESGVTSTVDPLGGSYFVESLTNQMEAEATKLIEWVERNGGMVSAIETGLIQREIAREAYRYQRQVESGERVVVGVNKFTRAEKRAGLTIHQMDESVLERQIARLQAVKARRDGAAVERALAAVRRAAEGTENLMPHLVTAVKAYATIGEIYGVLRSVWGEFKEPTGV
ncbi:MAG: methylmalonyl-CoA mutase [Chloroflexi bacterium]|nr:methylmalonyl-CoA mutase [Chloroflexota bacterium]